MNIISFLCYLLSWNITILFIETASHDRTEYFHDKDKMDRLRAYTNSPDGIRRRNNDIRFASKVLPPGLRSSERLHWAEDAQSKRTHSPHWYRGRTDMNSQIIPRQSPSPDNKLEKLQMRRDIMSPLPRKGYQQSSPARQRLPVISIGSRSSNVKVMTK